MYGWKQNLHVRAWQTFLLVAYNEWVLEANDADAEETLEVSAANDITRPFTIARYDGGI